MSEKAKDKSGYLYPNQKKSEKQPDWRGKLLLDGKEWFVSGWTRNDKDGMISFSLTDPADVPQKPNGAPQSQQPKSAPQSQSRTPAARPSAPPKPPVQQQSAPAPQSGDPSIDELNDLFGEFDK